MKNISKISYAVAAFLVTTATSCKKQLEEYNPSNPTGETIFSTPNGIRGIVNMSYQDLHLFYGVEDGFYLTETGTDLWYTAAKGANANQIISYTGLASGQGQPKNAWTYAYRGVNYCNTGLKYIDGAGLSEPEKSQRIGELRFLRALYYYHIVEQFGGVTLRTMPSTDGVDLNPTRSTPEQFYDLMISDLEYAKDNLPIKWPDAEYSRASKKSAMGLLARVLLTRAYYSTGSEAQTYFTKAKDIAVEAINTHDALGCSLYTNYGDISASVYGSAANRAANKEAMFVLAYNETTQTLNAWTSNKGNRIFKYGLTKYTGKPGMSTSIVNAYGIADENRVMPTWHLLDLYDETKDARYAASFQELWKANSAWTWNSTNLVNSSNFVEKDATVSGSSIAVGDTAMYLTKGVWGGRTTRRYMEVDRNELYVNPVHGQGAKIVENVNVNNYYPSFKKFVNVNRTTTTSYDFGDALIIRLAEMYLIAAEAYVKLGDQTNAAIYVNSIRKRATIAGQDLTVAPSDVTIDFILDERAREFAGECQRWYDLKRVYRGQDWVNYIQKWNPDQTNILATHWLRPVPQAELDALMNSAEFGQNAGY